MKRLTVVWASALVAVLVLGGFFPLMGTVKAAVPIPYNSWGHPYDETDVKMLEGELITSFIDGVDYGNNMTFTAAMDVWYDILTRGNWVMAPGNPNSPWEKEGGDLDEPIMYVWGDMTNIHTDPEDDGILNYGVFEEYAPWITNQSHPRDLNLSATQPDLFPKISMIVPEPTDGYGDYVLIYTEDTFFDMSQFYLEKNDGVLSGGPAQSLIGISNTTGYYYANLTDISLDACGDELKLVWINTGTAFGGMDVVVDRVEWNATTGGTHNVGLDHEPDNTDMTDASAPACGQVDFAMRRQGVFPVFDQDTNDNANDFVVDIPWPRPIIGPPVMTWVMPAGGEDWTGGADHEITWNTVDASYLNDLISFTVEYSLFGGVPPWTEAQLSDPITGTPIVQPFLGKPNPMNYTWTLPLADTDVAVLRVSAVNPALKSSFYDSNEFTIDSIPPTVILTSPGDLATDVPLATPINITFSECMNVASVDPTTVRIEPALTGVLYTWTGCDFLSIDHDDFLANSRYWVNISGASDDSDPGNLITPYNFYFDTYVPIGPTVDVTYPAGGEIFTGGQDLTIYFNATHPPGLDITYMWLNLTYGISSVYQIVQGLTDPDVLPISYTFTLPTIDADNCQINATIQDLDDGLVDVDVSPDFTCDSTPPEVIDHVPANSEQGVSVDTAINITFSEPVVPSLVDIWVRTSDGLVNVIGTPSWPASTNVTFTPDNPLTAFTDYTVVVNATGVRDLSDPGNFMAADYFFTFKTESTPPPEVEVTAPAAGAVLKGLDPTTITWDMSDINTADADLVVDLYYQYGGDNTSIVADLVGDESYTWTTVCPTSGDYIDIKIRVNVTDEEGQTGTNTSGAFTIDCTRPTASIDSVDSANEDTVVDFAVTGASETLSAYSWTFGDGGTSTAAAPAHTYADAGTYTVTLIVTDSVGWDSQAITKTITISKVDVFDLGIWLWIIIIIIIVVVVAIIAAVLAKRRKKPEEEAPPVAPEEEVEAPEEEVVEEEAVEEEAPAVEEKAEEPAVEEAAPAAAAAPAEEKPAGETKECPSCGTVVPGDATECFLCGATL